MWIRSSKLALALCIVAAPALAQIPNPSVSTQPFVGAPPTLSSLTQLPAIAAGTVLGNSTAGTTTPSALTTLPTGVMNNITRTGTLVAGATGAGFTVALGTSTVTGALSPANGGTGVANNAASTLTISGAFGTTLTVAGATSLTLPTSGTVTALGNTTTGSGSTIVLSAGPSLTGTVAISSTPKLSVGAGATPNYTIMGSTNVTALPASSAASGTTLLQVGGADAAASRVLIDGFAATAAIDLRRANNTNASPSTLTSGNGIGQINFMGWAATTNAYTDAQARINGFATATWSDTNRGTALAFSITPNASTILTEAMRIQNGGGVSIGSTTDNGIILDVTGTFRATQGVLTTQSGTTYTLAATDCGTTIRFTNGSAITLTTLNSLSVGCTIAILQAGAGQITLANGSGATSHSAHSYTKTFAQYSVLGLYVDTNSGGTAADFIITGDGA